MKRISILTALVFASGMLLMACNEKATSASEEAKNMEIKAEIDYLKAGKELAVETKSALAKSLVAAIGAGGSEGAVEFCNTRAIPITDSTALALGASIKRVSDKTRNSSNQATMAELEYIQNWKSAKAAGKEYLASVQEIGGKMVGYYPITTNQMCLQCHGSRNKDINAATLAKLEKLYPADQATGYADQEIRGIFVVEMGKK